MVTDLWTGLREQSTVGFFPELCSHQFSWAQVLVACGVAKVIIKQVCFAHLAGFYYNIFFLFRYNWFLLIKLM